jgi:hypothetical protein
VEDDAETLDGLDTEDEGVEDDTNMTDEQFEASAPSPEDEKAVADSIRAYVGTPTQIPKTYQEAWEGLHFDPEGDKGRAFIVFHPRAAIIARRDAMEAGHTADDVMPGKAHNDANDAVRHALWNYKMTLDLGPLLAKKFADQYERRNKNPNKERLMDLWNNARGRELALDPSNADRDPVDVIMEAMKDGTLRLSP